MEKYLEAKKTVCQAKCKKQKGKDLEALCSGMIRNAVCFKTAKRMVKTNQDIISHHCIRNYDDVLPVDDEEKKRVWKNYHEKLLNTEFA